jgi:signal transduction histidine kinase/tetratricopeptide (TPR) repeat protein
MKKAGVTVIFFISMVFSAWGQISNEKIIELKNQLQIASNDSIQMRLYGALASGYRFSNIDSSNFYSDQALKLANKLDLPSVKSSLLSLKSSNALESGNLPQSFQFAVEALKISEKIKNNPSEKGSIFNSIGNIYMELADYRKAIEYYTLSKEQFLTVETVLGGSVLNEVSNIGNVYELMRVADSALYYQQIVYDAALKDTQRDLIVRAEMMFRMGNAYKLNGHPEKALLFYKKGIAEANIDNDMRNLAMNNLFMAKLYHEMKLPDSTMKYAENALQIAKPIYFKKVLYDVSSLISDVYKEQTDFENAYKYLSLANVQRDSLTGTKKFQDLQRIILNEQERLQKENEQKIAEKNRNRQLGLLTGLLVLLFIAFVFYRNNRQKQKANKILEETLTDLKLTQTQLIQSEKMASLGELTAGIAHEIQNPLNFVNNFSEVSNELIDEMNEELDKGDIEEAKAISVDIKQNLEKINHHGKRADSIVKGMLQHSRNSNGKKESTNINALADEYLRLAYHGLRAKDKSFNATMVTDFDESVGKVAVISQDIGRVILNLITNAFYVVDEKKKSGKENYEPTVTVRTKKENATIEIQVSDNGNGIPEKILNRIFEPFFTTKPTGQGTGLGLSMSYDIVTIGHGGELKVATKDGEGTTFIIELPNV